jgi:hypothetical protein
VSAEEAGWGKLAQFMIDHTLLNINRHMLATIVNGNCMAYHLWRDGAISRPGFYNALITGGVHLLNFLEKLWVYPRPFFG